jgi:hypothetical protein
VETKGGGFVGGGGRASRLGSVADTSCYCTFNASEFIIGSWELGNGSSERLLFFWRKMSSCWDSGWTRLGGPEAAC